MRVTFLLENTRNIGGGDSDQRRLVKIRTGRIGRAGGIAAYRHERKMDTGILRRMWDFRSHRHAMRAVSVLMMVIQRTLLVVRGIAGSIGSIGRIAIVMMIMMPMVVNVECREDIAGIHAKGAHLKTGTHAQHK